MLNSNITIKTIQRIISENSPIPKNKDFVKEYVSRVIIRARSNTRKSDFDYFLISRPDSIKSLILKVAQKTDFNKGRPFS